MLACNLEKAWISASVSKVFYCSAGPCAGREALYLTDLINRILFIIMGFSFFLPLSVWETPICVLYLEGKFIVL